MSFLHNAGTVAKYEAVILRRSWFFRLFAIGALFIFIPLNIALFSPVGEQPWEFISISSSLPLVNLFLLNIGQAILVIFLAADFLRRDKKLDTNEVLYTRSVSNFEYVIGKTWGILRLFLGLNLIILLIALTVNITQKSMRVDLLSYLEYILIITVPTIVFSLGLAFLLMSVIRNQAVTFMVLLGIAALDMFWLWHRAGSIFDYMAFGLPVFKSEITGFDNPDLIFSQRLFYFFLGIAAIMCTVLMFKRLPQSRLHTSLAVIFLALSVAASAYFGFHTFSIHEFIRLTKKEVIEINRSHESRRFPVVTDAYIDLLHKGESIEATARLTLRNDDKDTLQAYLFSLNPALKVSSVMSNGKSLKYNTDNFLIDISPETPLFPGMTDSVTISYAGKINEAFCAPDVSDNLRDNINRNAMLTVRKRQYFLNDNMLLLTPETHWYPVASLNYYPSNPARIKIDFTNYTLRAKSEKRLTAVSQGIRLFTDEGFTFLPETPLTGLTLAMGNYLSDTLKVDSVTYITHYFPGNDYYKKELSELKDTLPYLVSGIMKDLETSFSARYPFKKLSIIEVPVHFYSYSRKSTQTRAEIQPSLILAPEKLSMMENAGFARRFKNQKKRMERNNQVITDKELQIRLFNDFLRENFISGSNMVYSRDAQSETMYMEPSRYRLGPSFYFYRNNFYSSEYPAINAVFESHLQHLIQEGPGTGYMSMFGNISEPDKANLVLRNSSFSEVLSQNPKGDTIRIVLGVKGDWLFNLLRAGTGRDEFNKWFRKYCEENEFRTIELMKFREDLKNKSGFDFYPYLENWYKGKEQPGFIISGLKVTEMVIEERSRYLVSLTASNPEPVPGVFNIVFRGGQTSQGAGRPRFDGSGPAAGQAQGRGMDASDLEKIVLLEPAESRLITITTDQRPRTVIVNTLFSRNIPGELTFPVNDISLHGKNLSYQGSDVKNTLQLPADNPGELIVDNEDSGFNPGEEITEAPLKRILGITNRKNKTYLAVSQWNIPEYWQPVVSAVYYGKYVRSAVYTRAGTGNLELSWKTEIKTPGYYDVFCYAGKSFRRMSVRNDNRGAASDERSTGPEGEKDADNRFTDFHFKIFHDGGFDDVTFDFQNAEPEWNNLGRFYISSDSARVTLSNKSSGKLVIGDAIKWVRVE